MADGPVNLNRARKARARLDKARKADANAVAFGRSKAVKARDAAESQRMRAVLDAHRKAGDDRDPGGDGGEGGAGGGGTGAA